MTSLIRTWTTVVNGIPTSQSTTLLQSQSMIYTTINTYISAGWTVSGSSCGGVATVGSAGGSKTITSGSPVVLSDAAAAFTAGMVGRNIVVSGASNSGNNGTFVITAVPSGTTLQYTNGSAVTETSTLTWSIQASAGIDGVNRITASSNLIWAAAGSAHGWILLKSPANFPSSGNFVYRLISCGSTSGNAYMLRMADASAIFTAGTTLADPTLPTNSRDFGASVQFAPSAVVNCKIHTMYSNVGDVLVFISQDGTGLAQHVQAALMLAGGESSDTYPFTGCANYSASTPGGMSTTVFNGSGSVTASQFWTDGTTVSGTTFGACLPTIGGTGILAQFTSTGSSISGRYPDFPVVIASYNASKIAFRGTLVDIAFAPSGTGIVQGSTVEPATGSATTTLLGNYWVPCGGSVPSL